MDISDDKLKPHQLTRVQTCRTCDHYVQSKAINLMLEKCKLCGCFIHLKVLQGKGKCPDLRW